MRIVDRILGWFLVVLGCVHNFVAAPMTYSEVTTQALWFISAGLALWYAGFLNVLRANATPPDRLLSVLCVLANGTLLAFVVEYAFIKKNWASAGAIVLIGSVAALTALSLRAFFMKPRDTRT